MIRRVGFLLFFYHNLAFSSILDGVKIHYDPLWLLSSGFSSSVEKDMNEKFTIETHYSFVPITQELNGLEVDFSHHRYGVRANLYSVSSDDESIYSSAGFGMRSLNPINSNYVSDYDGVNIPYYELRAGSQWNLSENTLIKTGLGVVLGGVKDVRYDDLTGSPPHAIVKSSDILMMDSGLEPHVSVTHKF